MICYLCFIINIFCGLEKWSKPFILNKDVLCPFMYDIDIRVLTVFIIYAYIFYLNQRGVFICLYCSS